MVGHLVEVPCQIHAEPCDCPVTVLITEYGELPEVVSRKHSYYEADDAFVRL